MTSMVDSRPYYLGLSEVAGCQQKSLTLLTYLVSIGWLLCLAFLFRWVFLTKISLNWLLTLTTQPSPSKLSDNPDCQSRVSRAKIRQKSMKLNRNFQQGGVQTRKPSMGGCMDIFWNKTVNSQTSFLVPTCIVQHLTVIILTFIEEARREGFRSASSIARDMSTTTKRWRI